MTDVVNGYGMTEGCGASTSARLDDYETGHGGGPLPNCKIRLRDLPEMGYTSASNPKRGEICFKGASIGNGYFDNQEKTDETFVNGWLLSGDVGEIDENGKITIIDRAKNIFKLANGEYIAPEKIENAFVQSEWVLQSWVYGDSLKDHIVLFMVVVQGKRGGGRDYHCSEARYDELCAHLVVQRSPFPRYGNMWCIFLSFEYLKRAPHLINIIQRSTVPSLKLFVLKYFTASL